VFKAHKERKAAEAQASALAAWQSERDGYAALVETPRNYQGETSSALLLHAGEVQFASVTNCALVEERKGPGTCRVSHMASRYRSWPGRALPGRADQGPLRRRRAAPERHRPR